MDTVSIFDPPPAEMRRRVAAGVAVTSVTQGLKLLLQIASVVVMSRLLKPTDFGVVAMTGPVVNFIGMFQELGLSQAAIQRPVLGQRQASTLYWMNVGAGGAAFLILLLLAPAMGAFYGDSRVTALLWASAPLCWFGSFYTLHSALLARQMRFRALALVEGAAAIAAFAAAILFGWLLHSYWALFAFSAASSVTSCIGFLLATRWLPSRPMADAEFRGLLNFGAGMTGFNVANFAARNLDNVLIGRAWGSALLGLYDRAYKLLLFPLQQINNPVQRVVTPSLARLVDDPARYRGAWSRTVRLMAMVTVPGIFGVAVCADWFVALALGPKWAGVVPIFRALAVAGVLQIFGNPIGWLFVTQGRAGEFARWGLFSASTCIVAFLLGLPSGPLGVAIAYAASELVIRTPALWWYVGRRGPVRTADIVRLVLPFGCALAVAGPAMIAIRSVWSGNHVIGLGIELVACYLASWAVLACFEAGRQAFGEGFSVLRQLRPPRRGLA